VIGDQNSHPSKIGLGGAPGQRQAKDWGTRQHLTPGAKSGHGEGIVQTPNPGKTAGAAKAVAGYENPLDRKVREGSSPSARTNLTFALASKPKSLRVTMIPLRRRGWHHPAQGKTWAW